MLQTTLIFQKSGSKVKRTKEDRKTLNFVIVVEIRYSRTTISENLVCMNGYSLFRPDSVRAGGEIVYIICSIC